MTKVVVCGRRAGNGESVCQALSEHLAENVAALGDHETLLIAELRPEGIVVWRVQRDQNGTPCARQSAPPEPWSSLYNDGVPSDQEFRHITRPRSGSRIAYVTSSPADRNAAETLGWLRSAEPDAATFQCATPLDEILRDVIANTSLNRWYELVVLRRARSGRLTLTTRRLFPPGATGGDREEFAIRCARSDLNGTAFAVVSSKSKERGFQLVSVQSAKIPPGSYQPIAVLRRPGVVDMNNLPVRLHDDARSWGALVAAIPERLERVRSSHLVCLIEANGTTDEVAARLDRARQLLDYIEAEGEGRVAVSVVCYGSHAVDVGEPDDTPVVMTWAGTVYAGIAAVERLRRLGPAPVRYTRAAQLECALAETAKRFDDEHGQLVLVTIGRRPPFPPRVDASEIIPCPQRHDWRIARRRLADHLGAVFGAIHDDSSDDQVWRQLGTEAIVELDTGAFNPQSFAGELGLTRPATELVPFPLIEAEED